MIALDARISPLKSIGTDLLSAGIQVFNSLWPDAETPTSVAELSKQLLTAEARLREWRSSSARAGADEALTFVLSWYEDVELNILKSLRARSKWIEDPVLIERRKEAASYMAGYAKTRQFVPGTAYSDDEDYAEEDDGEETESDETSETAPATRLTPSDPSSSGAAV